MARKGKVGAAVDNAKLPSKVITSSAVPDHGRTHHDTDNDLHIVPGQVDGFNGCVPGSSRPRHLHSAGEGTVRRLMMNGSGR